MRTCEKISDTDVGFGSLGTNNLEKALTLVCRALHLTPEDFEARESSFYDGEWYYKLKSTKHIVIQRKISKDSKYRVIVCTDSCETADTLVAYYHSICVKGKVRL